jgi:hypothetical protein
MDLLQSDLRPNRLINAPSALISQENDYVVALQGRVVRHPEFGVVCVALALRRDGAGVG